MVQRRRTHQGRVGTDGVGGHQSGLAVEVLGGLEIRLAGTSVPLGHARQKAVLAVLLVEANRVVSVDGLVDKVWADRAPARARSILRTYLSHLRRALAPAGATIIWRNAGYLLTIDVDVVDVHRFHRLLDQAREQQDPHRAVALAQEALALWRGEPLAELDTPWAQAVRERLRHERAAAEADRIDWALRCGGHQDLLPELTARAAEHPLDERVAAQLMLALYRSGRQADALQHYQHTRHQLAEELGTDPTPALSDLHQRILTADPTLTTTGPAAAEKSGPAVTPRQLPAAPALFVGRQEELDRLDVILLDPPTPGIHPHPLPDVPAALIWFDTEHACLLAAQHTATTHHWHPTVWHLAKALHTFLYWRGNRHDRLTVWQAAADAATHLPDPTTRILAHRFLGSAHVELGHHEDALDHLHQALTLAEYHHDLTHQARTHNGLARTWDLRGDDRRALDHARRALDLHRSLDQPVEEARALNVVGWYAARLGDYDTARDHCQAALTLHRHHHDPDGEAATLDSLGYIDHHSGHHHQAIDYYHHALTLARDLGNTYEVASVLDALGHPHAALAQTEQARTVWREALQLYRKQGRHDDATRVQQQLKALDQPNATK